MIIRNINGGEGNAKGEGAVKWLLLAIILCMGVMSQNVVPIHIAFIPMIIPPLLLVFNRLKLDRRLVACVITFGLVTTYMFLPYGFGAIFLNDIMLGNIRSAGMDTNGINVMHAMAIPALGMVSGLLLAFLHYRKPRIYQNNTTDTEDNRAAVQQQEPSTYRSLVAAVAIAVCFAIQLLYDGSAGIGRYVGLCRIYDAGRDEPLRRQRCVRRRHQNDGDGRLYYDCGTRFRRRNERNRRDSAFGRTQHGFVRKQ